MVVRSLLTILICLVLAGCSAVGFTGQTTVIVVTATPPGPAAAQTVVMQVTQAPSSVSNETESPQAAEQNTEPASTESAQAESQNTEPAQTEEQNTGQSNNGAAVPATGAGMQVSFDQLMDYHVVDASGNQLGDVKDAVINRTASSNGFAQIPFLVVTSNMKEDWDIPVPWKSFQVRPDQQVVVLPVNANQLAAAPGFNKDAWPGDFSAAQAFWANPAQANGAAQTLPMGTSVNTLRAKDVLSLKLTNPQGLKLGEIKDIAVDWANSQPGAAQVGQFRYLVIQLDSDLGFENRMVPIPWQLIQMNPGQEDVVVNLAQNMIQNAPNFPKGSLPNLYAAPWSTQLSQFWH